MDELQIRNYINNYQKFLEKNINLEDIKLNMSFGSQITHKLQEIRQTKLNTKEKVKLKTYSTLSDTSIIPIKFYKDKKYEYANWFFKYLATEEFEYDNKSTSIRLGEVKTKYTFIKLLENNGIICCPNCGNEIKLENINVNESITKCSYCNTIINDDDLKIKLANFNIWLRDKSVRAAEIYIVLGLLLTVFSCFILSPIGILLVIYGFASSNKEEKAKNNIEQNVIHSLLKFNNEISIDNIKDNIINKIKQIHYCEHSNQLSYFLNTNIDEYINSYQQVISSNVVNIHAVKFNIKDNIININFDIVLDLFCKNNGTIEERFENITISASREIDRLNEYFDASVFSCNNCGSNDIDLFNSGKCNHCGSNLDFNKTRKYDWVIDNYQAKFINYKK